jgi:predicted Fe-Mo cluster-binding NifX family protein
MKIAVPADDRSLEANVCISFGRSPYFLIYDTDNGKSVFLENAAADKPSGAGIAAAQIILDSGAEVLLTPRCGENAAELIQAGEIKLLKTIQGSLQENLDAYLEGKLAVLQEIHAGHHGHGGR